MSAELNDLLEAIKAQGVSVTLEAAPARKPFQCPVCRGAGVVLRALYDGTLGTDMARASCKSCNGQGVLWG